MSLTNDTLIHSLPYFHGPRVSSLMHLGWRASSPGPSHRSQTWESAPVLRMLFAQIAPFVFEYEMPFLNMTGDHTYSLRERLRCERYIILKWDCFFFSLLSLAVKKVLRILQVKFCKKKQKKNLLVPDCYFSAELSCSCKNLENISKYHAWATEHQDMTDCWNA